jgi:sigma-B regulation protein RsbU (phosphoserine phosphatase)
MLLFGIYFPHRLGIDHRAPWLKWLLIAPIAIWSVVNGIVAMIWLHNVDASVPLRPIFLTLYLTQSALAIAALTAFFFAMVRRSVVEREKDARRRIALLWVGAAAGLGPLLGIVIYALLTGQDTEYAIVPEWFRISSLVLMPLFPVTLAYVIVVQRAMNLRVAIRLGLKYTLARSGIWILRAIVVALALYVMAEGGPHQTTRVIGLVALLFILQKGLTGRVSNWLDRKFFREAYSAERVLSELSDEARRFTETGPLLETVTSRVADTLHIPRVCVLLRDGEHYCLANAADGFDPAVRCLPYGARAMEQIRGSRKPALISTTWIPGSSRSNPRKNGGCRHSMPRCSCHSPAGKIWLA